MADSKNMSLKNLIEVIDSFRDQYNTCVDPDVKKLCGFLSNVVDNLNGYLKYFQVNKARIEQSQQYYSDSLEVLDQLVADTEPAPTPEDTAPSLDDFLNGNS